MSQQQGQPTRPAAVHVGNAAAIVEQVRNLLAERPFTLSVDGHDYGPGELRHCRVLDGDAVGLLIALGGDRQQALFAAVAASADAALEPNTTQLQVDFHDGITLRRVGRSTQGGIVSTVFEITFTD